MRVRIPQDNVHSYESEDVILVFEAEVAQGNPLQGAVMGTT